MGKIWETAKTMFLAARYSIAFCLRNSRKATFALLLVSAMNTAVVYLLVQATGFVFNQVQHVMKLGVHPYSFGLFVSDFWKPLLFLSLVLLFGMAIGRLNWYFRSGWSTELRYANERELNDHRGTLDIARFRSKGYDDLSKQIQELPMGWQVRFFFSQEMLNLFSTIISFALFGAALLWYAPAYAAIITLISIPMMVLEFRFTTMWWSMYEENVPEHKRRHVLERVYRSPTPFIQGIMFNQMRPLHERIEENVQGILDRFDWVRGFGVKREFVTHGLAIVGLIGVAIHAIWSTVAFAGEFGTLSIIVAAARTFQGNLESIVNMVADQWNNAKGVILIEKDFLGLKPLIETADPIIPEFAKPPCIRFDRVSFTYPETENPVLKEVSFTIESGSKTAIVGQSGNGKSTIQSLLMRHYDPTSGAIYADDINLRNIRPEDWNEVATALTQEFTILERLVGEEIASSRLDHAVDPEAIEASARFAHFHAVVEDDPLGYEAQIGTEFGGRKFSGGEEQRLAVARAHHRGTPIIIFDEPDAKLDPESAQKLIDNIFALQGVTVVMITHHVSRAARCDKVIVMGKGEIAEQGRPAELATSGGAYAKLYEADLERLGVRS